MGAAVALLLYTSVLPLSPASSQEGVADERPLGANDGEDGGCGVVWLK